MAPPEPNFTSFSRLVDLRVCVLDSWSGIQKIKLELKDHRKLFQNNLHWVVLDPHSHVHIHMISSCIHLINLCKFE